MVLVAVVVVDGNDNVVGGVVLLNADSNSPAAAAEQPSDDAIVQNLGSHRIHTESRDLSQNSPHPSTPSLQSDIPPSSYRPKPAHPICQAERHAVWPAPLLAE